MKVISNGNKGREIYTYGCSIPTGASFSHPTGEKTLVFSDPLGASNHW